ncbi:TPA: hypothetical protein QFV83_000805 [Klebsiella aerogenes]|uniref:hypothetical protein n=1 Tax=Klebsiella aerogenes TaxID=548 RepID=UPI0027F9F114|nr:hypothetical protein [Klebsiella aerogenes]MEB5695447.1 hypothetical protein [Klebsiella aerogenes]HDT6507522.1 hypothetical protein [Klebsiella aerogenes]
MLRDYLKLDSEDQLVEQQSGHQPDRQYTEVTEWVILNKEGKKKGRVSLFDKFNTRRSWNVNFRITQFDNSGKVIVDQLTDAI